MKYIRVILSGVLLIFALLFIVLACSAVVQNVLTLKGRIFICIVSITNFILTTRCFIDELWKLKGAK